MNDVPDDVRRWPTREAIKSLSKRFGLPNLPDMQDWQWEVGEQSRVEELLAAYDSGGHPEDEQFTLMEIMIESFKDTGCPSQHPAWPRLLARLDQRIGIHISTVWCWAGMGNALDNVYKVMPAMRQLLGKHQAAFQKPLPPE